MTNSATTIQTSNDVLPLPSASNSRTNVHTDKDAKARVKKRYRSERLFRAMGFSGLFVALSFLVIFLSTIVSNGYMAFFQNYIMLDIPLSKQELDPKGTLDPKIIGDADFDGMVKQSLYRLFPQVTSRSDKRALSAMISSGAGVALRREVLASPSRIGSSTRFLTPVNGLSDLYYKGKVTQQTSEAGFGELSLSIVAGVANISVTRNSFENIISEIRQNVLKERKELNAQRESKQKLLMGLEARIASSTGTTQSRLKEEIGNLTSVIATLEAQLVDIDAKINAAGQVRNLDQKMSSYLIHINGGIIRLKSVENTKAVGEVLLSPTSETASASGKWSIQTIRLPESERKLNDREIVFLNALKDKGAVTQSLSTEFFTQGASREAEQAGVWVSVIGSFLTLFLVMLISFPLGVGAAIYLEEFAPKNRFTDMIEVNINNLAAVPSIIFGLLGLAIFLNVFGMPRSAPVVGGLVLALMTMPVVIIATRAAVRAVPPSIKEAALGVGASHQQAVFHHLLPLAMPGILTGAILGMARAMGETAPLLMIGMVAFLVDKPSGFTDAATLLPVQIFMWADFPEAAFQSKTAGAIIILLVFMITMNMLAVILRKRFERRW